MHMARAGMKTLPEEKRAYSEAWLAERQTGRIAYAVGISIIAPERRRKQALIIREAMEDAVTGALKAVVDFATEAPEIKRRMMIAREKA